MIFGVAGFAALAACGARSEIRGGPIETNDASSVDVRVIDVQSDSPPIDAGPCPPFDYVVDHSTSTTLAMDDAWLYYINPGDLIVRVAKDASAESSIANVSGFDGEFVVDDTSVYWTVASRVNRIAKLTADVAHDLGCAALQGCPGNVHVKTTTSDAIILVDGVQPVSFPKIGGAPVALAAANIAPPAPVHYVFADSDRVFWNTDIRVFSTLLDGGTPQPIQYDTSSSGLAIDSNYVFWTATAGAQGWSTLRSDKNAPMTVPLSVSATHAPLVANDSSVYGVAIDGGITRQPTQPGNVDVIVPFVAPLTILVDAQCVYYVVRTDTGRRIARAPN